MRFLLLVCAVFFTLQVSTVQAQLRPQYRGRAYLNLEEGQVVSIFNKPGKNWKNCAEDDDCEAVAWPDRDSEIEVISAPKKMKVVNPYRGGEVEEEYVQVKYKYERMAKIEDEHDEENKQVVRKKKKNKKKEKKIERYELVIQEGEGWIDSAYLTSEKHKTFYGMDLNQPLGRCDAKDYRSEKQIGSAFSNSAVTQTAELLKPLLGACMINPVKDTPVYSAKTGNPYDKHILERVSSQKIPRLQNEEGKSVTKEDLVTIDALSRTLYAEMAKCYKHGLHYPMAIAKIAFNRSNTPARFGEFIKGDHNPVKSDLAKVVTSPSQFSLWADTNTLKQAMCPPAAKGKNFWTGENPSQNELDIWQNTIRIATEMVLFPTKFSKRTEKVSQFFYTSGMKSFYDLVRAKPYPAVEDIPVSKDACVQIWEETPEVLAARKAKAARALASKGNPVKSAKAAPKKAAAKAETSTAKKKK